ncbi:hypothetical protein AgCh_024127 [Apium graveolens]
MKKLKIPTDTSGEEDGDVPAPEIIQEKHSRFSGALKSAMSDLFTTKRLGSRRFRSISLRSPSSKKLSTVQNNKLSKAKSDSISFKRSSVTNDVFKPDCICPLPRAPTTKSGQGSSVSTTASSFPLNSCSVMRNGSFEATLNELKQVQQQQQYKKNVRSTEFFSTNIGLSFIALSLLVLIVWGKVCAILCTSTWLLLMSARFKERGIVKKSSKCDDQLPGENVDSGEYKKRVIMEGLLDRNRSSSKRL